MNMIEKVARAICKVDLLDIAMEENIVLSPNGLEASVNKEWANAVSNARAAIEALRKPTKEMVEAAYECMDVGFCDQPPEYQSPEECWGAMIDAALSEPCQTSTTDAT